MTEEPRRASDPVIVDMATNIGVMRGTIETALKNQEAINASLVELHQKADGRMDALDSADPKKLGRVTDLENSRTRAVSYLLAATVLGGSVGGTAQAWAQKLIATFGGQ